jgi:hypothetical protein
LRVLEDLLIDRDGDFRDLMTTRDTFVDQRLASLYDIEAPLANGHGPTTLALDGRRHGLLGHASVLNLHAHSGSSSATLRGVFILQTLLCKAIPPPPSDVNTSIPEPDVDSPTLRERLLVHQEDPACATCHTVMDPIGLGLENFDGIGRWRDTENGATIDPSGEVDGYTFETGWTLGQRIREHENFLPCWAGHLYAYTTAHLAEGEVEAYTDWLAEEMVASDHSWRAMTLTAVTSDAFRQVGEVAP